MKTKIVTYLISLLLSQLTPSLMRNAVDKLLDLIEDYVAKTPGDLDDKVILPICKMLRDALSVPDNDV